MILCSVAAQERLAGCGNRRDLNGRSWSQSIIFSARTETTIPFQGLAVCKQQGATVEAQPLGRVCAGFALACRLRLRLCCSVLPREMFALSFGVINLGCLLSSGPQVNLENVSIANVVLVWPCMRCSL